MNIKSKLRSLLSDLIVKSEIVHPRNRVVSKQTIMNIIISQHDIPGQLNTQTPGGFMRILASDDANANSIASQIQRHKDDLGVRSVHIADKALDRPKSRNKESALYHRSVLLKLEPKVLLESATSILYPNFQESLREQVLGDGYNEVDQQPTTERVIIDFSSPNIAKPFHFGHLKSTILGNYLANINKFLGNHVTKLNYIGDWGTQYGLLSLGLEEFGDHNNDINIESLTLRDLVDIYVRANERGKSDEAFYSEAKRRLLIMDKGTEPEELEKWMKIKELSMNELKKSYSRLGIEFDEFEFESNYANEAGPLVERMKSMKFVRQLEDGAMVAQIEKNDRMLEIPVLRSDGASLYLTRDVAAAISRRDRFKFDKMLYVVGADQERHFHSIGRIIRGLCLDWDERLVHVKMGKVLGMSSRSGNFVLLSDIIDETTRLYVESTKSSPTTKVPSPDEDGGAELESVGHHLALSALFVYDMRNRRSHNYDFNWDQVMQRSDRSGINLQTTYARLSSLLKLAAKDGLHPMDLVDKLEIDALRCEEAMNLMSRLCELDTWLHSSHFTMDPSPLVNYALLLCKAINRARQSERLWVLGEPNESWARTRLSLFASSRLHLQLIIKLLGLKPLERV